MRNGNGKRKTVSESMVGTLRAASENKEQTPRCIWADAARCVPTSNGDCDPHEAQIDIPVNLPRTSFALHCRA